MVDVGLIEEDEFLDCKAKLDEEDEEIDFLEISPDPELSLRSRDVFVEIFVLLEESFFWRLDVLNLKGSTVLLKLDFLCGSLDLVLVEEVEVVLVVEVLLGLLFLRVEFLSLIGSDGFVDLVVFDVRLDDLVEID